MVGICDCPQVITPNPVCQSNLLVTNILSFIHFEELAFISITKSDKLQFGFVLINRLINVDD